MPLIRKFRVCFITFLLLASSLSLFIISSENVKADENDLIEILSKIYGAHPFVTAGWYQYIGNDTLEINGDLIFDLYYSTTFATQRKHRDDIEVTIYSYNEEYDLFPKQKGNVTKTLEPEFLGDTVQNCTVKLENINLSLTEGENLIFTVEIIQSGKPIGNIIERIYEKRLKSGLKKVGEFFNKSSDEELKQIGAAILDILNMTQDISAEEITSLADSLSSSSFVYNSKEYPSSVTLPTDSDDDLTLYFNLSFEDLELPISSFAVMTEETPNGTAAIWPTRLVSIDPLEPELNILEWMLWLVLWLDYIMQPPDEEEDENIITYYLDSENKLVTEEPEGNSPSRKKLSKDPIKWEGISLERNKIIKNATAELYLHYPRLITLRKININVTLFYKDGDEIKNIASDEKKIDRTTLLELLQRGPDSPTIFTFKDAEEEEIWYDQDIGLNVSVSEGPLFSLRSTYLLCDSEDYPSSITFNFEETDNIKILEELEDKDVIPGGSAEFVLNITSKYEDTVKINVIPEDPEDLDWSITVLPESVDIAEDGFALVHVFVNSTDDTINAADDKIKMTFAATGLTGMDSKEATVKVSEDAVDYDIIVTVPSGKEIKHGTNDTYTFKIKNNNTGVWPDSYEIKVSSEHDWANASYKIEDVNVGKDFTVNVTVSVPWYTDISSDVLTLTITSEKSKNYDEKTVVINVTTTVINPNIFESIYHFFESVAGDIGLDEILGEYAAAFLIFIVVFLILIFVIPILYLIRRKFVEIVCLDRIKDITPDKEAKFDITIQNPSKRTLTYEIHAEMESEPESWDISLDKESVVVEPKQSSAVVLTVKPTDYVKSDDWIEVKVIAKVVERKKPAEISTVTTIKDGEPDVKIIGVFHWPKVFKKGGRVVTSFRLRNTGNVSANNINVILNINGEEKNKVEDITIPRGGYAEIEMPWIAVKGKNEVNIIVK